LRAIPPSSCGCHPLGRYRTVGLHGNHIPTLPDQYGGEFTENKIRAQRRAKSGQDKPVDRTDYDGCTVDKVNGGQCTAFWL
jgi:hypothetical protein